jgi:release factor glutamine methyltransferase
MACIDFNTARKQLIATLDAHNEHSESMAQATLIIEYIANTTIDFSTKFDYSKMLTESQEAILADALDKVAKVTPVQYITNIAYFGNTSFYVDDRVLIPRQETAELCHQIYKQHHKQANLRIIDIACGSGCIGIYLKKMLPHAIVTCLDVSADALEVAQINAAQHKVDIHFAQADILDVKALPDQYDIIVSNPPYVCLSEKESMHANVVKHEPHLALFVPDDNALIFYEKIATLAKEGLARNGVIYFEINQQLHKQITQMLSASGFIDAEAWQDMYGNYRFAKCTNPH